MSGAPEPPATQQPIAIKSLSKRGGGGGAGGIGLQKLQQSIAIKGLSKKQR